MRKKEKEDFRPKTWVGEFKVLEDSVSMNHLGRIKTNKRNKKEMIQELRASMGHWMRTVRPLLERKKIDVAIVFYLSEKDYNRVDLDNLIKGVFDALKKPREAEENDQSQLFLIEDDSSIVRVLAQKEIFRIPKERLSKEEINRTDFAGFLISIRNYDPNKQMILIPEEKTLIINDNVGWELIREGSL